MKITKKYILALLLGLAIFINFSFISIAFAQEFNASNIIPGTKFFEGETSAKVNYVNNLPNGQWTSMIASVIKMLLQISGALAVAAFTYGGVMMITAQGNDEKLRKGKGLIYWSLIALVIIAVSFAIVLGVTQLKFFG